MITWHSPIHIFKYVLDDVVSAFWNRYPNDFSTHIISEDVLEMRIEGNKIITKKLIVKEGTKFLKMLPSGLNFSKLFRIVPCIEESIYDKDNKTLKTYTRNISHRKTFLIEERCVYSPNADDYKTSTDLKRSILVHFNYGRFSNIFQNFFLKKYKKRLKGTILGLNQVLSERNSTSFEKVPFFLK